MTILFFYLQVVGSDTYFYKEFFTNLREGLTSPGTQASQSESVAVIKSFMECFRYVLVNPNLCKEDTDDSKQDDKKKKVFDYLIDEQVCDISLPWFLLDLCILNFVIRV